MSGGWVLADETEAAARMAAAVRQEQHDLHNVVSIAVLTHPLWIDLAAASGPALQSHAEITHALGGLVAQARSHRKSGLIAVVQGC